MVKWEVWKNDLRGDVRLATYANEAEARKSAEDHRAYGDNVEIYRIKGRRRTLAK